MSASTSNSHAKADGAFILRPTDTFTISGCSFTLPPSTPHPCVQVQWIVNAQRSTAAGDPALNKDSVGLCKAADGAPQGTVLINQAQAKAKGS